jgi:hypothetical protein
MVHLGGMADELVDTEGLGYRGSPGSWGSQGASKGNVPKFLGDSVPGTYRTVTLRKCLTQ